MRRTDEAFAAEVYRRGEQTIKENRKRRRALLTTLPVAVCVLAMSVAVLPKLLPKDKATGTVSTQANEQPSDSGSSGGSSMGALPALGDGGNTQQYGGEVADDMTVTFSTTRSVEVVWTDGEDGQSRLTTDAATIVALESRLPQEAVEAALRAGGSTDTLKGADGDGGTTATANKTARPLYRFVLTAEDGTRRGYVLSGSELYVEDATLWLPLTEDEAAALQETLRQILSDE